MEAIRSEYPQKRIQHWPKYLVACLVIAFLISSVYLFCLQRSRPVYLGFIGGLTGRIADLGIAGRNGVQLAVEVKNDQGGIGGRPIVLLVEDDKQSPQEAIEGVLRLMERGVVAVVGPMTSSIAIAIQPVLNEHRLLGISPTVSTNELTGLDDYFYRVYPCSMQTTQLLAEHAYSRMGVRSVTVIYDTINRAHTESNFKVFKEAFESHGGIITGQITFLSGSEISFTELARQAIQTNPDCLYLLMNAMDTALFCQQMYKMGRHFPLISSDWSLTDDIIEFGGQSVEGILAMHTVDRNCQTERFLEFQQRYRTRFGDDPGFSVIHAYDAAMIVFKALEKESSPHCIREAINSIGTFEGLQTTIAFNPCGDVKREHFTIAIRNGKFVQPE